MAVINDAIRCLEEKLILGENGPCTNKYVILSEDEHRMVLNILKNSAKRRRVPNESSRETATL